MPWAMSHSSHRPLELDTEYPKTKMMPRKPRSAWDLLLLQLLLLHLLQSQTANADVSHLSKKYLPPSSKSKPLADEPAPAGKQPANDGAYYPGLSLPTGYTTPTGGNLPPPAPPNFPLPIYPPFFGVGGPEAFGSGGGQFGGPAPGGFPTGQQGGHFGGGPQPGPFPQPGQFVGGGAQGSPFAGGPQGLQFTASGQGAPFGAGPHPGQFQGGPQPGLFQAGPQPGQFQGGQQPGQFQAGPQPGQFPIGPQPGQFQAGPQPGQFPIGPQPGQFQAGPQPGQFQAGPQPGQFPIGPQPGQFPLGPQAVPFAGPPQPFAPDYLTTQGLPSPAVLPFANPQHNVPFQQLVNVGQPFSPSFGIPGQNYQPHPQPFADEPQQAQGNAKAQHQSTSAKTLAKSRNKETIYASNGGYIYNRAK